VKETRCQEQIVAPLWTWLSRARARLFDPEPFPLWPFGLEAIERKVPQPDFANAYTREPVIELRPDTGPLLLAKCSPLFSFARGVAFPRALRPLDDLDAPMQQLLDVLKTAVEEMREHLATRSSQIRDMGEREGLANAIAFAALEKIWGFPESYHNLRDGKFLLAGRMQFDCAPEIGPELDAVVAGASRGFAPEAVVLARRELARVVGALWRGVWYVVELGIDAE
jgi:hypothetical protein